MSLIMYHDSNATEEITNDNPDQIRESVPQGGSLEDITSLYLKSNNTDFEYENVSLEKIEGQGNTIYVDYNDTADFSNIEVGSQETLDLDNGDYDTPIEFYRRVTVQDVTDAFKREDIEHRVNFDEYVK